MDAAASTAPCVSYDPEVFLNIRLSRKMKHAPHNAVAATAFTGMIIKSAFGGTATYALLIGSLGAYGHRLKAFVDISNWISILHNIIELKID